MAIAGGRAYCPLDGDAGPGGVRITGFEVTPGTGGTEIRFAASGAEVERYLVYRRGRADHEPVLVADGSISSDRVVRIVDPTDVASPEDIYAVEVFDRLGRAVRASAPEDPSLTVAFGKVAETSLH